MKKITLSLFAVFSLFFATGQNGNWCGTDKHMESLYAANPGLETEMHERLSRLRSEGADVSDREDEFIIPVVVHILHDNGVGNISYEQVMSGINMLNEDFNRENADAVETRNSDNAPFLSEVSDMGVRFELAKIDPDGNCTNGIQRRNVGSLSYNGGQRSKKYNTGGLDGWNRNYYMNIWIVNSIESDGAGTILGYAEFPYGGGSSNYGVIIRNDAYGYGGTASGDRTLTHEIGHCLGLLHTFQGGCHAGSCDGGGDYCCDTPPVSEAQWSCSITQNTCDDVPIGDVYGFDAFDQFENFMSYSPCQNMYSKNQAEIVIDNLTSIGFLENLVDPSHYDETGVGVPAILCKADFYSNNSIICEGNEHQFFDASFSNVTDWTWTFEGGSPATSNEINPIVSYATAGNYSVTLEVTDGITTETKTMENYVLVMPTPGTPLPYSENFETIETIPDYDRFVIINEDEDEAWALNESVGYSGTHSIWLKNRGVNSRALDVFISGTIDLSEVDPDEDVTLSFKYAYKRRNSGTDEYLRFYISNDCGESWVLRKNIAGDDLGPEIENSSYEPENQSEWYQVDITNINPTYYTANFRYKFEFKNDNGNNIYIDDINFFSESMVSIDELEDNMQTTVYPNPSSSEISILLGSALTDQVTISMLNSLGQQIDIVYAGQIPFGENIIPYSVTDLPKGIYYINIISASGDSSTIRFIKN